MCVSPTTMVLPFIDALGYNIFNTTDEVIPEYTASIGSHKDARADYAIIKDGEAFAVIECKAFGTPLDVHKSQLEWYFVNSPARIGILTDGNRYIFYSDLEERHVMDKKPFMDFTLTALDKNVLPRLKLLCKDKYNPDDFIETADKLKFSREFRRLIDEQFKNPDDDFARLFIGKVYSGKLMSSILEKYKPVLKEALAIYVNDQIAKRLDISPIPEPAPQEEPTPEEQKPKEVVPDNGIVTHNTEVWGYMTVKAMLAKYIDPKRIYMKDQKTKCAILRDAILHRLRYHAAFITASMWALRLRKNSPQSAAPSGFENRYP